MRPATLPPAEILGPRHPHGTRIRYMGGCQCVPCRAANSRYNTGCDARVRAGERNDIVSAAKARAHIHALSAMGIGRCTVARIARVSRTVVMKIRSGERRRCRRQTGLRILEVGRWALADGALVDATLTWQRIEEIRARGWSKARIAKALGLKRAALQIARTKCRRSNARRIARLHRQICGVIS